MFARLAVTLVALSTASDATSMDVGATRVDFCQFAESAASYEGQSVILAARIVETAHGWFAKDDNCSKEIVLLYPEADPDKLTLRAVSEASNRGGSQPEKVATFRANVVIREWRMPQADVVRDRPYLEVTEVIAWEAVE